MGGRHVTFAIPAHTRLVVWDFNGTLIDDVDHCVAVINGLLREHDLAEVDLARYRTLFDFPVRRYYERLGFQIDDAGWPGLASRFIAAYDDGVRACSLRPGATAALGRLASRGVEHAVLSAARRESVEDLLGHLGVRDRFTDVVALGDHYAEGKLEVGRRWASARGHDPGVTVLVGDTLHDHEVAEALGWDCVLVAGGHHDRERLERSGRRVVESLDEL